MSCEQNTILREATQEARENMSPLEVMDVMMRNLFPIDEEFWAKIKEQKVEQEIFEDNAPEKI